MAFLPGRRVLKTFFLLEINAYWLCLSLPLFVGGRILTPVGKFWLVYHRNMFFLVAAFSSDDSRIQKPSISFGSLEPDPIVLGDPLPLLISSGDGLFTGEKSSKNIFLVRNQCLVAVLVSGSLCGWKDLDSCGV
ncbi:hypothetical protein CEXT_282231 [Caerostris extrusa]|uniref:Uncharacterized protein n=1 Tax=Caerostris extrusa TaxID=172846 RepID=A0AAV4XIE7_CAEEX|nr:hypothetical protein CEXT_282231 [Caerostris extrusa]